jgi:hypothetical protein
MQQLGCPCNKTELVDFCEGSMVETCLVSDHRLGIVGGILGIEEHIQNQNVPELCQEHGGMTRLQRDSQNRLRSSLSSHP